MTTIAGTMQLYDKNGNLKNLQEYNLSTIEDKGEGVTYVIGFVNLGGNNEEHVKNFLLSLKSDKNIIFDVIANKGMVVRIHGYKYPNSSYIMATLESYFGSKEIYSCNRGTWNVRKL